MVGKKKRGMRVIVGSGSRGQTDASPGSCRGTFFFLVFFSDRMPPAVGVNVVL